MPIHLKTTLPLWKSYSKSSTGDTQISNEIVQSVFPLMVFEFVVPILQNLTKLGEYLHQNVSFKAVDWLNSREKASFLHIFTKSVKPIFQSAGPISWHKALEVTLSTIWTKQKITYFSQLTYAPFYPS